MESALLIGGGGYVGRHIAQELSKSYKVRILDFEMCDFPLLDNNRHMIDFFRGSFLDEQLLSKAIDGTSLVVHLAAVGMSGAIAGDTETIMRVNAEGTRKLVEKSIEKGVRRFIYASSVCVVFNGEPLMHADESLPIATVPMSTYCESKALGEAFSLGKSNEDFKVISLRFRGIYGPAEPRSTERAVNMIRNGLFVSMTKKGSHEALTSYTSIESCLRGVTAADKSMKERGVHGEAYNIVDSEVVGAYSFWRHLVEAMGEPFPDGFAPYLLSYLLACLMESICYPLSLSPPLNRVELALMSVDNVFSTRKAEQQLGFVPVFSQMPQTVAYYLEKYPNSNAPNVVRDRVRTAFGFVKVNGPTFMAMFYLAVLVFSFILNF